MKPAESVEQLIAFAANSGVSIRECHLRDGFEQFFGFYESARAEGCGDLDADKLLFQWGVYDWGQGRYLELNLTRQFIEDERDDDDAISQLSLTFKYDPSPELAAIGEGSRWSDEGFEANAFREAVFTSKAFQAVAQAEASHIELTHSYV